jgi:hypothetical protein
VLRTSMRARFSLNPFRWSMRLLFSLVVSLPTAAFAEAQINVRIEFSNYRVSPYPGPLHSHVDLAFSLRDDGTLIQEYHESGPKARNVSSDSKLGQGMHVVDANTLVRKIDFKDRLNTLTINVSGKTCRATMTNTLKPGFSAFEARSSHYGIPALYRDWHMTSSTCTIR